MIDLFKLKFLVSSYDTGLIFLDKLRFKGAVTVTKSANFHLTFIANHTFGGVTITCIFLFSRLIFLIHNKIPVSDVLYQIQVFTQMFNRFFKFLVLLLAQKTYPY